VFLNAPGGLAARLIASLNKLGANPVYFGTSIVPGEITAKALGSRLRSLTISEVMPYPLSRTSREIEDFRTQAAAAGVPADYSSIEGYVSGLVLVDALRRAGPALSPARVHAGIRSVKGRFCGVDVNFGSSNSGSGFVELIHVDGSGRVVR
jgi:branched-chain amino acid transport system substrate-binding protein